MRAARKILSFMFSRMVFVAVMILLQIAALFAVVYYFSQLFLYFYLACLVLSILVALTMLSRHENPEFKIVWIVIIMAFPVFGGIFYLYIANRRIPRKLEKKLEESHLGVHQWLPRGDVALEDPHHEQQSGFIQRITGYPLWKGTSTQYFPVGELMFEDMMREVEKARHYIFLEYFIVRPGYMWSTLLEALKRKVAEGVAVYLMYDDIGSITSMTKRRERELREAGIRHCVFNKFRPHVSTLLNCRDHRKLMVADGKTAFCGGINIADEYINRKKRLGHWKDTGIRLRGSAVRSFVLMFIQQWRFATHESLPVDKFVEHCEAVTSDGKIHVFDDSPLDAYNIAETVYRNAIGHAKKYIYITTPYLIIDYAMMQALCTAAASGVDVRIYTPHLYDKWYVHTLTRSNYAQLIRFGVKIFEYTPGFMHAKMLVSDDNVCMVGTCNMDFRSFYLHFECSVLMYDSSAALKVRDDMLDCQAQSHEVAFEDAEKVPIQTRILRALLRLFAPLM